MTAKAGFASFGVLGGLTEADVKQYSFLGAVVPYMLACMLVEAAIAYFRGKSLYRVEDTVNRFVPTNSVIGRTVFSPVVHMIQL